MKMTLENNEQKRSEPIVRNDNLSSSIMAVMESLKDSKAENICHIENTSGRSLICDNMLIVSGRSSKHVSSIADNLVSYLKNKKIKVLGVEGLLAANWVLIDIGDVMVHVLHSESRALYDLESMWT